MMIGDQRFMASCLKVALVCKEAKNRLATSRGNYPGPAKEAIVPKLAECSIVTLNSCADVEQVGDKLFSIVDFRFRPFLVSRSDYVAQTLSNLYMFLNHPLNNSAILQP